MSANPGGTPTSHPLKPCKLALAAGDGTARAHASRATPWTLFAPLAVLWYVLLWQAWWRARTSRSCAPQPSCAPKSTANQGWTALTGDPCCRTAARSQCQAGFCVGVGGGGGGAGLLAAGLWAVGDARMRGGEAVWLSACQHSLMPRAWGPSLLGAPSGLLCCPSRAAPTLAPSRRQGSECHV